jgi:hypothetical protein
MKKRSIFLVAFLALSSFSHAATLEEMQSSIYRDIGRQASLRINNGIQYSLKEAAGGNRLLVVAVCADQTQVADGGGCEVKGPAKQQGSSTTSSLSDATLQSFGESYSSVIGHASYYCTYTNLKAGDIVTAKVNCK